MVNASQKEKMLRFQIPTVLKDDLVYCQRSLRHFVKVHQVGDWNRKEVNVLEEKGFHELGHTLN